MKDYVEALAEEYPYDPEQILATACGSLYVAIMLRNGQIGVCSTLNNQVETDPLLLLKPDLKRPDHRMMVIAYANAHLNYLPKELGSGDIFDLIDFAIKKEIVMVGYFPPLVEKFRTNNIPLSIFDAQKESGELTPISLLNEKLQLSDCVIITSTSLLNQTFSEITSQIKSGAEIYLLGPTTPLDPGLKKQYNIRSLFGMLFKNYDFELLTTISQGMGTQSFSKKSKKVSL